MKKIGFTCAYTPVPVIEAAGFSPFRIYPEGDSPDQAGHLLHDNLCPHVKRVLDKALANDLPDLEGMVFINSCDSMRRLSDAWQKARPDDKVMLLDLPSSTSASSITFLAKEYRRMGETLFQWNSKEFSKDRVKEKISAWNSLAESIHNIEKSMIEDFHPGSAARMQNIINSAAQNSVDKALSLALDFDQSTTKAKTGLASIFIFGNLLFDPKVFDLFEEWNMHVSGNDFCTGSRFISAIDTQANDDIFKTIAISYLQKMPCARTMDTTQPMDIAQQIVEKAKTSKAQGVIGFTLKFCDPYLARIPMIREALQKEGIPFLMLEGDCTMGSIGQQQTRIEAFTEMLGV
jgi:benzoyl-CoA reductase/2-hydroxyglutaryl-CoA dehydratase subunit BcrC/BadD/HgdB